jgi:hypothetical protein
MEFNMRPPHPIPNLPSLKILQDELERYRKTGRAVHLAHATRALGDLHIELQALQASGGEQVDLAADSQEIAA